MCIRDRLRGDSQPHTQTHAWLYIQAYNYKGMEVCHDSKTHYNHNKHTIIIIKEIDNLWHVSNKRNPPSEGISAQNNQSFGENVYIIYTMPCMYIISLNLHITCRIADAIIEIQDVPLIQVLGRLVYSYSQQFEKSCACMHARN